MPTWQPVCEALPYDLHMPAYSGGQIHSYAQHNTRRFEVAPPRLQHPANVRVGEWTEEASHS